MAFVAGREAHAAAEVYRADEASAGVTSIHADANALSLVLRNEAAIVKHCKHISDERLYKALEVLLTLQNVDCGWATYENNRGNGWYEWLNPSEVFGDIMIEMKSLGFLVGSQATLTLKVVRKLLRDQAAQQRAS